LYEGGIEIKPKPSNEDDPLIANELKTDKRASVRSDWNTLVNHFMSYPKEEVLLEISQQLLQVQPTEESLDIIKQFVDNSTKERQIITFCAAVMSLPEFQLG